MRTDKLAACHERSTPETDSHCTPRAFFEYIEKALKVKFTIDIAASKQNTLTKKFISKGINALTQSWKGVAWCNPPYSRVGEFVGHAYENSRLKNGSAVILVAARTDREWWSEFASKAFAIVYIQGRLKFVGSEAGAPFPSVLLVFKKGWKGTTKNIYLAPTPYERGFQRGKPK